MGVKCSLCDLFIFVIFLVIEMIVDCYDLRNGNIVCCRGAELRSANSSAIVEPPNFSGRFVANSDALCANEAVPGL